MNRKKCINIHWLNSEYWSMHSSCKGSWKFFRTVRLTHKNSLTLWKKIVWAKPLLICLAPSKPSLINILNLLMLMVITKIKIIATACLEHHFLSLKFLNIKVLLIFFSLSASSQILTYHFAPLVLNQKNTFFSKALSK